jgi:hypothetical protein
MSELSRAKNEVLIMDDSCVGRGPAVFPSLRHKEAYQERVSVYITRVPNRLVQR